MNPTRFHYDHETLIAYQHGIQVVGWATQLLENMPAKSAIFDQLDRASTSVSLNIAEGNSKHTAPCI